MLYTINQLREKVFSQVFQVYQVFQNFFGEQFVDLQNLPSDVSISETCKEYKVSTTEEDDVYEVDETNIHHIANDMSWVRPFILVYWPTVKVTNEHDKCVVIQDLYAKIELDAHGYIPVENRGFLLNRATYPIDQWVCSYMHSHIQSIPKTNPSVFMYPCLGTGPIKNTINCLKAEFCTEFDETRWMLFCQELSLFVTVESLAGIPYKKLEEINISRVLEGFNGYSNIKKNKALGLSRFYKVFDQKKLKDFILYYLMHGHLSLGYQEGAFVISMPYFDFMIDISNTFIEWFNSNLENKQYVDQCFYHNILCRTVVAGKTFYEDSYPITLSDVNQYIGSPVCNFKGHEIKLNIFYSDEYNPQKTIILNHELAMFILNNILKIINYRYTNEYNRNQGQDSPNNTGTTALTTSSPTCQTTYYI